MFCFSVGRPRAPMIVAGEINEFVIITVAFGLDGNLSAPMPQLWCCQRCDDTPNNTEPTSYNSDNSDHISHKQTITLPFPKRNAGGLPETQVRNANSYSGVGYPKP